MSLPRQSSVWDLHERRPPSHTAVADALAATAALHRTHPALVRWVLDGHPHLTEREHLRRFGEPYGGRHRQSLPP